MADTEKEAAAYGMKIGRRTFLGALCLLVGIMILAGILTRVIPQGAYQYRDVDGRSVIIPGTYEEREGAAPLPVWRWATAPVEVLGGSRAVIAITIIVFIMLLVGSFMVLEKSGLLSYLIYKVIRRFGAKKYRLLAIMVFICMIMGSFLGMMEETVTLVPITIALSLMLGWDSLVGVSMSVLAVSFGFAAGTFNPFTVGIAQNLAELPLFSGFLFRLVFFAATYGILIFFLTRYAKKIDAHPEKSLMFSRDEEIRRHYQDSLTEQREYGGEKKRALVIFAAALVLVFCYIAAGFFVPPLSDYVMPVMALLFTAGALTAGRVAGLKGKIAKTFFKGLGSAIPSAILILLAMSVTHIMEKGNIIDTILYYFYTGIENLSPLAGALAIYAVVLFLEFFIAGASAKAFLLIPIIIPLCDMIGITRQTAVQSFILGDGFTNMFYPTNVLLLITLGIANIPYGTWFRWIGKMLLALFIVSVVTILIAVSIGYGPF
ncbi:C4-dicarboxylate ABC transporter [Spirochaetia bacterium]|nr:C4-dicarboxylate ABC transporter [Spirochaetia bacterium]